MRKCAGERVVVCVRVRAHVHHGNYSTARCPSGVLRVRTLIGVFLEYSEGKGGRREGSGTSPVHRSFVSHKTGRTGDTEQKLPVWTKSDKWTRYRTLALWLLRERIQRASLIERRYSPGKQSQK